MNLRTQHTGAAAVIDAVRAIVGAANVLTEAGDVARHTSDWRGNYPGAALAVVRPGSTAEVAAVVATCAAAGVPIVPQGGNTGLVGGSTPDESQRELVLSLTRLSAIRDVNPTDNTMTVEAGCSVLVAQEAAAARDRLFPLSLGSEGTATIGGVLATNAGGEQVLRYGNARDLALGLEVVLADGRVLHGLSALRKDNTGYDLKDLFIGAEGTLGIITAATLKLFAQPRKVVTGWLALSDPRAAVQMLTRLGISVGDRVTAFELIGRQALDQVLAYRLDGMRDPLACGSPWAVLFEVSEVSELLDPSAAVEAVLAQGMEDGLVQDAVIAASNQHAHDLWALRDHIPEAQRRDGPSIKHDIAVPVSRIADFIAAAGAALQQLMPGIRIVCFGHVGDGNVHYNQSKPAGMPDAEFRRREDQVHDIVHRIAIGMNGSISAEHGIGRLKQGALLQYKQPLALELMARIKLAFDAANTFNPGRLLPRERLHF